jgi:hypothetical protein
MKILILENDYLRLSISIVITTVVATPPAPLATAASNIAQTSFTANWNVRWWNVSNQSFATSFMGNKIALRHDSVFSQIVTRLGQKGLGLLLVPPRDTYPKGENRSWDSLDFNTAKSFWHF